jgi:anaerobic selenocysteine-containing dehydrogenase
MCGIQIDVEQDRIAAIRGDELDPFSRGYVCPKVMGLQDVHEDPDRLRTPLARDRGGDFRDIAWEEAFDRVASRLRAIRRRDGADAIAVYQGNPTAHNLGLMTFGQIFLRGLGTRNLYSATSVDQLPHMLSSLTMLGHQLLFPIPDIDRTDTFLIFGANPIVSNGSVMTAANARDRLAQIRRRGGRVVVVDPRRTETAQAADEHVFIRPGTDALMLLAMIHVLFAEDLVRLGRLAGVVKNIERVRAAADRLPPERAADATGVPADVIRRLARELAGVRRGVCYGRLGVSTQEFGGICSWLINVVNILTGRFDEPGGAMFPRPAVDTVGGAALLGHRGGFGRFRSRVRGLPEFGGELPAAVLAEEIETPGRGQIRALITSAGNPVLSTPNGRRLDRALASLEFMVSIDIYLNETTRHADVILPPTFALERDHCDLGFQLVSVRNVAKYSQAPIPRGPEQRHDWEIMLELASRLELPDGHAGRLAARALRAVGRRVGPRGLVDLGLRLGPYDLSLRTLEASPHGVDLGPLEPRLPAYLHTRDRKIDLAPEIYLVDLRRLEAQLSRPTDGGLRLIGRRQLRSNNSWLHNSARLVKGKPRCTLLIHPDDAAARGLNDGDSARLRSRVGSIVVPVELSGDMMPGVVSLPHGWGHDRPGIRLSIAAAHAGASMNDVTDEGFIDELSGNSRLSGVPVEVTAA